LSLRWTGDLSSVFVAQSLALVAFGLVNATAVWCGAWFGPLRWPWSPAAVGHRRVPI
jgi:hypothetical protein